MISQLNSPYKSDLQRTNFYLSFKAIPRVSGLIAEKKGKIVRTILEEINPKDPKDVDLWQKTLLQWEKDFYNYLIKENKNFILRKEKNGKGVGKILSLISVEKGLKFNRNMEVDLILTNPRNSLDMPKRKFKKTGLMTFRGLLEYFKPKKVTLVNINDNFWGPVGFRPDNPGCSYGKMRKQGLERFIQSVDDRFNIKPKKIGILHKFLLSLKQSS